MRSQSKELGGSPLVRAQFRKLGGSPLVRFVATSHPIYRSGGPFGKLSEPPIYRDFPPPQKGSPHILIRGRRRNLQNGGKRMPMEGNHPQPLKGDPLSRPPCSGVARGVRCKASIFASLNAALAGGGSRRGAPCKTQVLCLPLVTPPLPKCKTHPLGRSWLEEGGLQPDWAR